MSKKSTYWTIGIIAAIVIIAVIWLLPGNSNTSKDTENNSASHEHNTADSVTVTPGENSQDSTDGSLDSTDSSQDSTDDQDSTDSQDSTDNQDSDNLTAYMEDQDRMMNQMMIDMGNIPESDYAATDFLAGMIPHHEAAVTMAESYLKYGGENEKLTTLANSIIETQTKEIEEMNGLMQEYHSAQKEDPEKAEAHMKKYKEMFAAHHMGHGTSTDNVDAAFAEGMIEHHRMAVEMAENILDYTDEEDVINLAKNIIATQNEEIGEMQSVLDSL